MHPQYDIVRLPGFEFGIAHPESAYREALLQCFPDQARSVQEWFYAREQARRSAFTLFAMRAMPPWLAFGLKLWRAAQVEHWAQHSLAAQLAA